MKTTKNKIIKLMAAMLLITPVLSTGAQAVSKKNNEPDHCLTVSGKILNDKKNAKKKVTVYLIHENTVIDSLRTYSNRVFSFRLKKNQEYSIKIVEPGLIERLVSISTRLPQKAKNLFEFHFDLLPLTSAPEHAVETDILDFPIALIYYNPQKSCFDYNRKYTDHIKNTYREVGFQNVSN